MSPLWAAGVVSLLFPCVTGLQPASIPKSANAGKPALSRERLAQDAGDAALAALNSGHVRVSITIPRALLRWNDNSCGSAFEVEECMLRKLASIIAGGRGQSGGLTPLGRLSYLDPELCAGRVLNGEGMYGYKMVATDGRCTDLLAHSAEAGFAKSRTDAATMDELIALIDPARRTVMLNCAPGVGEAAESVEGAVVPAFSLERVPRSRHFLLHTFGGAWEVWQVARGKAISRAWACVGEYATRREALEAHG